MSKITQTYDSLKKTMDSDIECLNELEKLNDRKEILQLIIKLKDNNKKTRENIILVKSLTEKQIKKLNSNIKTLELRVELLELKNKELKSDNTKLHNENKKLIDELDKRQFIQGLSDIYRNYDISISNMLDECVEVLPKSLRLDLNSIIGSYIIHSRYKERKNVYIYVQEFREIILPNIERWYLDYGYGKWNWEFFVWFHQINSERNGFSYDKKETINYKQILIEFKKNFEIEHLVNSIPKLNKFKSYLIEYIDSEIQTE